MLCSVLTRTRMFSLALALLGLTVATPGSARDFEVWLVDQSDSFGKTYGGTIYIYEGSDLNGANASSATPTDVLDLGGCHGCTSVLLRPAPTQSERTCCLLMPPIATPS